MVGIHLNRSVPTVSSDGLISSQKTHALRLGGKKNIHYFMPGVYRCSVRKRKKDGKIENKGTQKR